MSVSLYHQFLFLSAFLFMIGALGVLLRRNILIILMCVELMLNAVNLSFAAFAYMHGSADGHVFAIYVIAVAAAEAAVGLGLAVVLANRQGGLEVQSLNQLREWAE